MSSRALGAIWTKPEGYIEINKLDCRSVVKIMRVWWLCCLKGRRLGELLMLASHKPQALPARERTPQSSDDVMVLPGTCCAICIYPMGGGGAKQLEVGFT